MTRKRIKLEDHVDDWDMNKNTSTASNIMPPTNEEFAKAYKRMIQILSTPITPLKWTNNYTQKEYQEPERDEQGTLYGYKVLLFQYGEIISPQCPVHWSRDGVLVADRVPTERNTNGIYCTKRDSDEQIYSYYRSYRNTGFVVRLALSGTVVETETGFRAEKAQIIAVHDGRDWISFEEMTHGNRQNSQNYTHKKFGEDFGRF